MSENPEKHASEPVETHESADRVVVAKPSEAARASRRNLLIMIALLAIALGAVLIIRWEQISTAFGGQNDAKKSVLDEIRDEEGRLLSPIEVVIEKGGQKLTLKALQRRWAISSQQDARVMPGKVALLKSALEIGAAHYGLAEDAEGRRAADLTDALLITMTFEKGQKHSFKVKGENVLYVGAERSGVLPGLALSADPDTWTIKNYDLMSDFDYGADTAAEARITPENYGGISCANPNGPFSAARHVASGRWAARGNGQQVVGRNNVLNRVVYTLQHLNINGLWQAAAPTLYHVTVFNEAQKASLWVSMPVGSEDAALQIDENGALYRISAVSARGLLPSFSEVNDAPVAPPPEGVDAEEIVGLGAGLEMILIAHNESEGDFKLTPQGAAQDRKTAQEYAALVLAGLQQIEDMNARAVKFAELLKEDTAWRDYQQDLPLSRVERFPAHAEEFHDLLEACKNLKPGELAPRVFSLGVGEVIVWCRLE